MSVSLALAPVASETTRSTSSTARATPTSSARCVPPLGRRPGGLRGQRGRGRRGADRGRLGAGGRARAAPADLRQQARPGAGHLRAHPRRAAGDLRRRRRPPRAARSARRPASGASPTCSPTPPSSTRAARRRPAPSPTIWPARAPGARALVEGIVVADDDLMERYLEGEIPEREELEETLAPGWRRPRVPGGVRVGDQGHRHRPAGHLPARSARRPTTRPAVTVRAGDTDAGGGPRPDGPPLAWVCKTSPTPTSARSACSRCCRAPSGPTPSSPTPAPTPTSEAPRPAALRGKEPDRSTEARPATSAPSPSWPTRPPATPWRPRARRSSCPGPGPSRSPCRSPSGPSPRATRTSS